MYNLNSRYLIIVIVIVIVIKDFYKSMSTNQFLKSPLLKITKDNILVKSSFFDDVDISTPDC